MHKAALWSVLLLAAAIPLAASAAPRAWQRAPVDPDEVEYEYRDVRGLFEILGGRNRDPYGYRPLTVDPYTVLRVRARNRRPRHGGGPEISAPSGALCRPSPARHDRDRYALEVPLPHPGGRRRDPVRHRRGPPGILLGRTEDRVDEAGVAGVASAQRDAEAPARPAALHARRHGQPAG